MADAPYPLSPADAALSAKQRAVRDLLVTRRLATERELLALAPPPPAPVEPDPKEAPPPPVDVAALDPVRFNGAWYVKK